MKHRNRSRRNSITATARYAAEAIAASVYFVQKKISAAAHSFIIPARSHICLYGIALQADVVFWRLGQKESVPARSRVFRIQEACG